MFNIERKSFKAFICVILTVLLLFGTFYLIPQKHAFAETSDTAGTITIRNLSQDKRHVPGSDLSMFIAVKVSNGATPTFTWTSIDPNGTSHTYDSTTENTVVLDGDSFTVIGVWKFTCMVSAEGCESVTSDVVNVTVDSLVNPTIPPKAKITYYTAKQTTFDAEPKYVLYKSLTYRIDESLEFDVSPSSVLFNLKDENMKRYYFCGWSTSENAVYNENVILIDAEQFRLIENEDCLLYAVYTSNKADAKTLLSDMHLTASSNSDNTSSDSNNGGVIGNLIDKIFGDSGDSSDDGNSITEVFNKIFKGFIILLFGVGGIVVVSFGITLISKSKSKRYKRK